MVQIGDAVRIALDESQAPATGNRDCPMPDLFANQFVQVSTGRRGKFIRAGGSIDKGQHSAQPVRIAYQTLRLLLTKNRRRPLWECSR